ncbi:MAG TPA: DUF302 domain-containing protein [Thiobacillaceae bacterium]|nr:DUF302 domain-containing protein [Thiobacillaceae bacterium]
MRAVSLAVSGIALSAFLFAAPPVWAAAPKVPNTVQTDVYKIAIEPGVSIVDAAESMRLRANALNLQLVAELPMSKQVEAVTGKPQRTITIYQFCDAVLAKDLIDVNLDFSIFMPCRIALIEDAKGQGWVVMMDVNVNAVAQEKRLPPELKARIETVRKSLVDIMQAGAKGEL